MNLSLSFEQFNEAESALAKARAIVEVVSTAITAEKGTQDGARYSDSLWAACDELDKIKGILAPEEATP